MVWFKNPIVWLVMFGLLVIVGIVIFAIRKKPTTPDSFEVLQYEEIDDGETQLDLSQDNEEFGMYGSALPNWLEHHDPLVDRYTRRDKQQIHGVSSLNTAIPPTLSDYIPYNEGATRFQTPRHHLPAVNPNFNNHIRATDLKEE